MFKFDLENILELRKHFEDAIQSQLSAISQLLKAEEETITALIGNKEDLHSVMEEKFKTGATSNDYRVYAACIEKIDLDIILHARKIKEIEKKRDQKRDELAEAVKKRKALERLKENKRTAYKAEQEKIELTNLDDFAGQQFIRKMEF